MIVFRSSLYVRVCVCVCVCVCVWKSSGCVWSFLMEVSFSGCDFMPWQLIYLTDVGLKCLAALPNLFSLSVSYLACLSDRTLEAIASRGKLQELFCKSCLFITDVGCIRYLQHFFKKRCSHVHLSFAAHLLCIKLTLIFHM